MSPTPTPRRQGIMRYVVITGASSGIGKATALLLGEAGYRVFAGVERDEDARALEGAPQNVIPVTMDVTDPESIRQAVKRVSEHIPGDGEIGLVNNAGIAVYGPLEHVELDEFERQFRVNLFGVVAVTQAFLPLMRRQGGGCIINMGSMNGRLAIPIVGPYCATKFGLRSVSDTLRLELAPWGINVSLVEAGVVATPLVGSATRELRGALADGAAVEHYGAVYTRMEKMADRFYRMASKPETVARTVLRILRARRPRPYYRVGVDARAAIFMEAFVPVRARDWMTKRLYGFDG